MALPPGFLDELRARLTLSDVVGRKVTWDRRKSNPGRGDFWAPCPFHQEKTPSFHVEDRKGFYYCFGCHAKGDLIGFVKETENLSFMEAVERLAAEAGLEVPRDPRAAAEAREDRDREAVLFDVMEQAAGLFARALRSGAGQEARAYLQGRGIVEASVERFELGFAPDRRTALAEHFRAKGLLEVAIEAGLVIRPEDSGRDGGAPYDRFRGRLMFPIRDARGRVVAFGGRAMSPEARAKYLNSPETPLFSKGRTLYNAGPARAAAGKAGRLIVAEGYMDVIALAQAGFEAAVAPLGTAITETQLSLLWRMAPEPVVALDGDAAGMRAAHRLIDLALPGLGPGRSLAFCLMPAGQDPDDLIRSGGPGAMQKALEAASPLVEMLWRRETEGREFATPEARAALEARLRTALGRIEDAAVRGHYGRDVKDRLWRLFRPAPKPAGGRNAARGRAWGAPPGPAPGTRTSALARAEGAGAEAGTGRGLEASVLLTAFLFPEAARPLEAALDAMPLSCPDHEPLRAALVDALAEAVEPITRCREATGEDPVAHLARSPEARGLACTYLREPADDPRGVLSGPPAVRAALIERLGVSTERLRLDLEHRIARQVAQFGAAVERADARADFAQADGEDWTWRAREAREMRARVDARALKQGESLEPRSSDFLARALQRAENGEYARKNRRNPS